MAGAASGAINSLKSALEREKNKRIPSFLFGIARCSHAKSTRGDPVQIWRRRTCRPDSLFCFWCVVPVAADTMFLHLAAYRHKAKMRPGRTPNPSGDYLGCALAPAQTTWDNSLHARISNFLTPLPPKETCALGILCYENPWSSKSIMCGQMWLLLTNSNKKGLRHYEKR